MKIFKKGKLSDGEIVEWLKALRKHSYVPESGYAVSAVFRAQVQGADDYYFSGVNVENIDHRLSTHGEEGCIAAMVAGLGKSAVLAEGWIMGAPQNMNAGDSFATCCGKCRQQIAGLAGKDAKIHYVSLNGKMSSTTVGAFLPDLFVLPVDARKGTGSAVPSEAEVKIK